ncbi:hypothetical protein DIPPA_11430 [Diplonema papillatum]|nr:hypothetical protein DIPPA_11430 [Diplonema papillatum]
MTDVPEEELLAALATCDRQKADRPADEVAAALAELRTDLFRASALPCGKLAFAAKNGLWPFLTDACELM